MDLASFFETLLTFLIIQSWDNLKINIKSKLTLFNFLMHVPDLIVHTIHWYILMQIQRILFNVQKLFEKSWKLNNLGTL